MHILSAFYLFVLTGCGNPGLSENTSSTTTGQTTTSGHTTIKTNDIIASNLSWRLHDDIKSIAYVSWDQDQANSAHVEYTFENDEWLSTPSFDAISGTNEQIIVGVPYSMDIEWRVVIAGGSSFDGENFSTGSLPSGMPTADVVVSEPSQWLPEGNYLLSTINQQTGGWVGGDYWTFIMDRQGRMVWAHKAPDRHWTLFSQVALSGDHFMWDEATYWSDWDEGAGSTIHRTYLDDEIDEISTPGLHHAWVQIDEETIAWGSQHHGGREALVERTYNGNDETVLWTCQDDWPSSGSCESNGLFYVKETESFLYSFYTNNSVVEVDRFEGTSLWWAGEVNNGYRFSPSNSQFSWQHGISYTDTGSLLVSTEAQQGGWTTMVREYEVDHGTETLNEIWNYDAEAYANTNGDAWRLDNGNTLHLIGSAGEVKEVDANGNVLWHVDFNGSHLLGRGEFIEDLYALVKPR